MALLTSSITSDKDPLDVGEIKKTRIITNPTVSTTTGLWGQPCAFMSRKLFASSCVGSWP